MVYSLLMFKQVFHIDRPFKGCGMGCFPCCIQEWNVLDPQGNVIIGSVTQPLCGGG